MSEAITWSTKLKLVITTPSDLKSGVAAATKEIYTFERLSVSRNREQRMINSVAGARKGFTTVEGDFSLTISLPETDPNTYNIEKLYDSNAMFDVKLVEMPPADSSHALMGEWKIVSVLAIGCMFENASTSYDANDKPMREYTAKFLKSSVAGIDSTTSSMRDGNYTISVQWGT